MRIKCATITINETDKNGIEKIETILKIFCLDHRIKRIINLETHENTIFVWYEESNSLLSKIKYDWIMSRTTYIGGGKRNLLERFFAKIRKTFNIRLNW